MIICFDLDSTLLPRNKIITEYTKKVFKRLKEDGHLIVINSARHISRMIEYIDDLHPDYFICDGGSLILDSTLNILFEDSIDSLILNNLYNDLKDICKIISFQSMEYLYTTNIDNVTLDVRNNFSELIIPYQKECYKILVYSKDVENTNQINNVLKAYPLELNIYEGGHWGKIAKKEITKLSGLEVLLKLINKSFNDCLSFGDDLGDIGFLKASFKGICPSNSLNEVKDIADYICGDIDSDGVARWLNNYFNLKIK